MLRMLMLKNTTHLIFFPHNARTQADAFRLVHKEFKRRKIRDVIQAFPEGIEYGKLYQRGTGLDGVRFEPNH